MIRLVRMYVCVCAWGYIITSTCYIQYIHLREYLKGPKMLKRFRSARLIFSAPLHRLQLFSISTFCRHPYHPFLHHLNGSVAVWRAYRVSSDVRISIFPNWKVPQCPLGFFYAQQYYRTNIMYDRKLLSYNNIISTV